MQPDDFLDELMDAIECRYPGAKANSKRIIEERGGIRPFAEFWAKVLADVEAQKSIALTQRESSRTSSLKTINGFCAIVPKHFR